MDINSLKETSKKNFGLTEKEFDQMVTALQQGEEQLFEHIYLQHFEKCVRYLENYCGADYEDAYSSTMDALLEIRKDLALGKIQYGNLAYFFTYRAKKKFSKVKQTINIAAQPDENAADSKNFIQSFLSDEMTRLVSKALASLGEECTRLIKMYYYNDMTWPQIARVYYPQAEEAVIETKSNTLKRKTSRKCLPSFKSLLKKLL